MSAVCILSGLTRDVAPQPNPQARNILILNLMPNRAVTEQQFARTFACAGVDVNLTFILPATHHIRRNETALRRAYHSFRDVEREQFDALIVTGAPLDQKQFADVDYWDELQTILQWRHGHVRGSLFLCWGALAAGHIDGTFEGERLDRKICGVYRCGQYLMPQSRYFRIPAANVTSGSVLAGDDALGACIISNPVTHSTYVSGHFEYLPGTLAAEYHRDRRQNGADAATPQHYFDRDMRIRANWQHDAASFYRDWLNAIPTQQPTKAIQEA